MECCVQEVCRWKGVEPVEQVLDKGLDRMDAGRHDRHRLGDAENLVRQGKQVLGRSMLGQL